MRQLRSVEPSEDIAQVLLSIRDQAGEARDSVAAEAESVGCEYQDFAMMRRGKASQKKPA
jgi:hypothetical protein